MDVRGYRGRRRFDYRNAVVPANVENNTPDVEALRAQLVAMQQSLDTLDNQ